MRHYYVPACKRGLPPTESLLYIYKPVGNLVSGFARQSCWVLSFVFNCMEAVFPFCCIALDSHCSVLFLVLISYFSDGSIFSTFHHNVHHHTHPRRDENQRFTNAIQERYR